MDDRFTPAAETVADRQRHIQANIDARAREGGGDEDGGAVAEVLPIIGGYLGG